MHPIKILKNCGITYYKPKLIFYPNATTDNELLNIVPNVIAASCLAVVTLPEPVKTLSVDAEKIFNGMLGVLELPHSLLAVAKVRVPHTTTTTFWQEVSAQLQYNQPKHILWLGEGDVTHFTVPVYKTYHPEYLCNNKQDKRAAFQVLLKLKQQLE